MGHVATRHGLHYALGLARNLTGRQAESLERVQGGRCALEMGMMTVREGVA